MSIFYTPWWLSSVSDDGIHRITSQTSDKHKLTVSVRNHPGFFKRLVMPQLTRFSRLEFELPESGNFKAMSAKRKLIQKLYETLNGVDLFKLVLPHTEECIHLFSLVGFKVYPEYTYRIEKNQNLDEILINCDQKMRNQIRSSSKELIFGISASIDDFIKLSKEQWGVNDRKDYKSIRNSFIAASIKNQGGILLARNSDNLVVGAAVLIWDEDVMYFLESARRPGYKNSGVISSLIWNGLKFSRTKNLIFDLDGYKDASAGIFLLGLCVPPVIRWVVEKKSLRYRFFELSRYVLSVWGFLRKSYTLP